MKSPPDDTEEGIQQFCRSLRNEAYLFFVDGNPHRKGIGRKGFQAALADCPAARMTVNAFPYAVPVCHKLGFTDTDAEQVVNGLRFTPMEYR